MNISAAESFVKSYEVNMPAAILLPFLGIFMLCLCFNKRKFHGPGDPQYH